MLDVVLGAWTQEQILERTSRIVQNLGHFQDQSTEHQMSVGGKSDYYLFTKYLFPLLCFHFSFEKLITFDQSFRGFAHAN